MAKKTGAEKIAGKVPALVAAANPALVQDFYNQRRRHLATVQPNAAHRALAPRDAAR